MTTVWFIRHGESLSNAGHVVANTHDVELTDLGHRQAQEVSAAFDTAPDLVILTPYLRTHQTAAPLLQKFPDVKKEIWPLQEFSCLSPDKYNNTSSEQRLPHVAAYWDRCDPEHIEGPGAESFNQMSERIETALARLQQAPQDFVAVFAHGWIMQTLRFLLARPAFTAQERMQGVAEYIYEERSPIANGQIVRLSATPGGIILSEKDRAIFEAGFDLPTKKQRSSAIGNF